MIAIGRLLPTDESVIALGLLTMAVLVSPPRGGALSVALVMVAAIASTGGWFMRSAGRAREEHG